jgi:polyvinyl alcohol dehydrogenase (cytochrome)
MTPLSGSNPGGNRVPSHRAVIALMVVLALTAGACSDDGGGERVDADPTDPSTDATVAEGCDWPVYGQSPDRTFAVPGDCETAIAPDTVAGLARSWFFNTEDVVTATPAVVDGTVYVGDWSGAFYALDAESGAERWRVQTDVHDTVYSGQIVSSAAVADVGDEQIVYVGGGMVLYALDTATGDEVWTFDLSSIDKGDDFDTDDGVPDDDRPTEVQSSPVVVDGKVIVGFEAHDRPGFRGGLIALDAATGSLVWDFDPDQGIEPTGCGGVWGSPSVDLERELVFGGTASCGSAPEEWSEFYEGIFALDLDTGEPRWSFQPRVPYENKDFDFAGSPNLFTIGDRDVVGLGGKDGRYYVMDRETGDLVWEAVGMEPDVEEGAGFSFGGFIGPTAVDDGVVVGGTAGNGATACPCLHAFDADTGEVAWRAEEPQPIFGASAIANGVVFSGGTDFTFRALDLQTGDVLWSTDMPGVVAGGSAIVGDDVFAVAGIREPGTEVTAESAGVFRFTLDPDAADDTATTTTTAPGYDGPVVLESPEQPCVGTPCEVRFALVPPPDGLTPTGSLVVTTDPFTIHMEVSGLGDPEQWVAANAPDADEGADVFALMISVSDENPLGTALCSFEPAPDVGDDAMVCDGDTISLLAPQYNRLSIIALPEGAGFPSVAEGVARLVWTEAFETPLVLVDPPPPTTADPDSTAPTTAP